MTIKYKYALLGGIFGVLGLFVESQIRTMNSDPLFIFSIPAGILRLFGPFRCDLWDSDCPGEDFVGAVITIAIFSFIGLFLGEKLSKRGK